MGRTTTNSYNVLGQEVSVSRPNPNAGPANVVTSYIYDALGNQVDRHRSQRQHDHLGLRRLRPPGGDHPARSQRRDDTYPETFYVYDADDQLVEEVAPAGPAASSQQRPARSRPTSTTTWAARRPCRSFAGTISSSTTTDATALHLVYSGTTELTTAYGYDADGNQVTVTDPLANVTTYQYDHLNRLLEEIQPSPDGVASCPTTLLHLRCRRQQAHRDRSRREHDDLRLQQLEPVDEPKPVDPALSRRHAGHDHRHDQLPVRRRRQPGPEDRRRRPGHALRLRRPEPRDGRDSGTPMQPTRRRSQRHAT